MIATRFLKKAFWKTGISPARLMNNAMQANANDDNRRYMMPLFLGETFSNGLKDTVFVLFSYFNGYYSNERCGCVRFKCI